MEKFLHGYKVKPLVEKHLEPFRGKLKKLLEEVSKSMRPNSTDAGDGMKKHLSAMKEASIAYLPRFKALKDEFESIKVPDAISAEKEEDGKELDFLLMQFEEMSKMDVDAVLEKTEKIRKGYRHRPITGCVPVAASFFPGPERGRSMPDISPMWRCRSTKSISLIRSFPAKG